MRLATSLRRLGALLALATLPAPAAQAAPAAACHCYQDRSFDPQRPSAADPYILATARSSLLSATFGVEKRSLIGAVMTGTPAEELWVAYAAAAATGRSADDWLSLRAARGSWKAALAGVAGLEPRLAASVAAGAEARELASLVVDGVLAVRLHARPADLLALRAAGATPEERVLATVLASERKAPALPLAARVRAGQSTWGQELAVDGLAPKALDGLIRRLVALGPTSP
jgi:hypothetical protein